MRALTPALPWTPRRPSLAEGETHVPTVVDGREGYETPGGAGVLDMAKSLGVKTHGFYQLFGHLTIGWPSYILAGLTGGSKYGNTNHLYARTHTPNPNPASAPDPHPTRHAHAARRLCVRASTSWPRAPFSAALWPGKWANKVLQSAAGVFGVIALLGWWARRAGAATVWAFYGGPYLVVNSTRDAATPRRPPSTSPLSTSPLARTRQPCAPLASVAHPPLTPCVRACVCA